MPNHDENYMKGDCDICGEPYDANDPRPSMSEVAEFCDPDREWDEHENSFVAHAQCGLDAGYELA